MFNKIFIELDIKYVKVQLYKIFFFNKKFLQIEMYIIQILMLI